MSPELEIISVGNLNMDLIGKMEKLPSPDEKILLDNFARRPGGGAANFAVACSRLGLKTGFIGSVGNDSFGVEILKDLKEEEVETSPIKKVDASTGLAFVLSTAGSDRLLIEHRGANTYLDPADLREEYIEGGKLIHASSVTPKMAAAVGKRAEKFDLEASLDLGAELTKVKKGRLLDILENFDVCFMNKETFENIFEEDANKQNILEQFPEGLKSFIVTLGSHGAIATDGEKAVSSPTYDVEVRDATGAGDALAAAFDKFYLDGASLKKSIRYGASEAAIKIQHLGARKGLPTPKELENFVKARG